MAGFKSGQARAVDGKWTAGGSAKARPKKQSVYTSGSKGKKFTSGEKQYKYATAKMAVKKAKRGSTQDRRRKGSRQNVGKGLYAKFAAAKSAVRVAKGR